MKESLPILEVEHLCVEYFNQQSSTMAVKDVSFHLCEGEVLGIVGESGSGKSTIAFSIINLLNKGYARITNGSIKYKGTDLVQLNHKLLKNYRGKEISMIFQNPASALDPVYTIGSQIVEKIRIHSNLSKKEAKIKAIELLEKVGIDNPKERYHQYPHEFSGGMQQRVLIAIAIACSPKIIIADEPTTALDVITQHNILQLLSDICEEYHMSVIFITHDMGVVAQFCDRMIVMRKGEVVEQGDCEDIFYNPKELYTQKLLAAIPKVNEKQEWLLGVNA